MATTKRPRTDEEIENRIQEAIDALPKRKKINLTKYAADWEVPYYRLRSRMEGALSQSNNGGHNKLLNEAQELALCLTVQRLDNSGFSPTRSMLQDIANDILKQAHNDPSTPPPTVSTKWPTRFLQRHPELFIRSSKTLAVERETCTTLEVVNTHFARFEAAVAEYGVLDEDIWNMDETGFHIGVGGSQKIITTDPKRKNYILDPNNRELVTVLATINGGGEKLPPFLIFEGKRFLEKYVVPGLDNIAISFSDTGYTNDQLGFEYLKHFERFTAPQRLGRYRMLIYDGHNSHNTYEFLKYCWDRDIIPFSFPSHTTHLLQPLDVKVFQPYKHWHKKVVNTAVRTGATKYDKVDFLYDFAEITNRTFKSTTIHSAWRHSGLIPFNPSVVLTKITAPEPRTPSPDPPLSHRRSSCDSPLKLPLDNTVINTPQKIDDLERELIHCGAELALLEASEAVIQRLSKVRKGVMAGLYAGKLAEEDLSRITAAIKAREARS
jgi:hypothetical protein